MRVYNCSLVEGIRPSPEFKRKGLAEFAVNVGTKCGHGCAYCSTGAVLRCHPSFKDAGESPFGSGYAIVDAHTAARVQRNAANKRTRGLVQICTTTDAWAPEAAELGLGRRCLEAVLGESHWWVRILTKNIKVMEDFDLIQRHRDRVLVGLSLTSPARKSNIVQVVEPHASLNQDRMDALQLAHRLGLRTYGMLCPLLPGIADGVSQVQELVDFVLACGAEEVFVEPLNSRGSGTIATQAALAQAGFSREAHAIGRIRQADAWSAYAISLLENVQNALSKHGAINKLRFLLYASRLTPADLIWAQAHGRGVKWL